MSAVVDFPVKPEARPYLAAFGRAFGRHARGSDWLFRQRRRSLLRFAELGFPSRRSEAWRYLDLRALETRPMLPAASHGAATGGARGAGRIGARRADLSRGPGRRLFFARTVSHRGAARRGPAGFDRRGDKGR